MKKRALDKVYDELDAKYSKMPDDKIQGSIDDDIEKLQVEMENMQKQIDGMKTSEKGLDDETRKNLEKEINKKSQKINNLKGYKKNKAQIVKIIEYRDHFEEKLVNTITARDDSKKAYNEAEKDLAEINKLLKDANKTEQMDQYEYNDLQIRKENAEKEIKEQGEILYKLQYRINQLKGEIGKCDLAWRTLFVNKTWDDIQLRATSCKSKYTGKGEKFDPEIRREIAAMVKRGQELKKRESQLPAKATTWSRIKNFFRTIPNIIKEKFGKEKNQKDQDISNFSAQQKDKFLDFLRQNVDVDYREAVRKAKEQQYIEKHKAKYKTKSEPEQEQEQ